MSLSDALQTLAQAHGAAELARAFHVLQGQARRLRRATDTTWGTLSQTFVAAMRIWDQQKADGVSKAERLAGLEQTLRAAWPQTRAWHYLCVACSDLGLELFECDGGSACGRTKRHLPHTYGRACVCAKGAAFREAPKPEPADFKAAGRSKPLSRMGR
jgi:hypothetical protein